MVDIVYTWVNGADKAWLEKKKKFEPGVLNLEPFGNVSGRFRDNGELKYSLRSLCQNFPSHGKVYLVTDGHKPEWLSDAVTVIDHSEIIDKLPTFSSKKIEANLFKIKGLSTRWLSLNDDVFFGGRFDVKDYFDEHGCIGVSLSETQTNGLFSHTLAQALSVKILGGECVLSEMAHGIRAVEGFTFLNFKKEQQIWFDKVNEEIFRTPDAPSVLSDLYGRWLLKNGLGFKSSAAVGYKETVSGLRERDWRVWSAGLSNFCINDTCDDRDNDPSLETLRAVLDLLWPEKSKYEK